MKLAYIYYKQLSIWQIDVYTHSCKINLSIPCLPMPNVAGSSACSPYSHYMGHNAVARDRDGSAGAFDVQAGQDSFREEAILRPLYINSTVLSPYL